MSQNVPKLRKLSRIRKVLEKRAKGQTIEQISLSLNVSEKTVDRDLKSETVQAFLDELVQQQIIDITSAVDINTRLTYRSDLLDKLLPKKQEIKQDVSYADNRENNELLKLITSIDKQLIKTTILSTDNTEEPIHTQKTTPENGKNGTNS